MRPIERIPIVLDAINMEDYINGFGILTTESVAEIVEAIDLVALKQFWEENPDLRLTQVLVNMGYIPNAPGLWYYREEFQWLIENDVVAPRDILFWGINYDKDMNRIPHHRKLIKDLDTDHIEAILDGGFTESTLYLTTFQHELNRRTETEVE